MGAVRRPAGRHPRGDIPEHTRDTRRLGQEGLTVETREVAPGLWLWRQERPGRSPDSDWSGPVSSWCVESGGDTLVVDALAPEPDAIAVWEALDTARPDALVILKPDHARSAAELAERWWAPVYGPAAAAGLFEDEDIDFRPFSPGDELPGEVLALDDGRGRHEHPVYLPEQRALLFADGLTSLDSELRIWDTEHLERARDALERMLELPFRLVCVSHGEPVHDREAFEAALEREPYRGAG